MTPTFDGPKKRQEAIVERRGSLSENPPPVWAALLTSPWRAVESNNADDPRGIICVL